MLKTFWNLTHVDFGLDPNHVVMMHLRFPQADFSPEGAWARQQEIVAAVRQTRDVVAVGAADVPPVPAPPLGLFVKHGETSTWYPVVRISGDYFASIGRPLIAGRSFSAGENDAVVVSRAVARQLWDGANPIGNFLQFEGEDRARRVAGVAKDGVRMAADNAAGEIYIPHLPSSENDSTLSIWLSARYRATSPDIIPQLMEQLKRTGSDSFVVKITTVEDQLEATRGPSKMMAVILGSYGLLALGLAFVGVYSLLSYVSFARTYEMGVRMALGAQPLNIALLITEDGMLSAVVGVAVGTAGSLATARLLSGLVFGVAPLAPTVFGLAILILLIGCTLASVAPVLRLTLRTPRELLQTGADL